VGALGWGGAVARGDRARGAGSYDGVAGRAREGEGRRVFGGRVRPRQGFWGFWPCAARARAVWGACLGLNARRVAAGGAAEGSALASWLFRFSRPNRLFRALGSRGASATAVRVHEGPQIQFYGRALAGVRAIDFRPSCSHASKPRVWDPSSIPCRHVNTGVRREA